MPVIEINNLIKKYGDLTAVNGISLSVERGEIFGILGPNGAGKTTTLEMVEGLRKPDGGTIKIDGKSVWPNPKKVKEIIGVQLQSTSLFDYLKVKEIIELFASFYGIKLTKDKLASIIDDVGLAQKAKQYVNELSGGQQQRLSIALALVNDPIIIFLDEPTTGLDPQARRHLWDVIKRINKEGTSVVITTHYMEEAEVLCERIAVMDKSKLIKLDTPANLIKDLEADTKITFTSKTTIDNQNLKKINGVKTVKSENGSYTVYSDNVQASVTGLFDFAKDNNMSIFDMDISGANLEDVFLSLTGRALRD
jgi:ABC-2 type transport system ATP-binding protein